MDMQGLIEAGRKKLAAARAEEERVHVERERAEQAERAAFIERFKADVLAELPEVIHPFLDFGEGPGFYAWSGLVEIDLENCATFNACFERKNNTNIFRVGEVPSADVAGRWKLTKFYVGEPFIEDEDGQAFIKFRLNSGYGFTETDLGVALARAAEMFAKEMWLKVDVERINLEHEDKRRAETERETRRLEAQRGAFHPFTYYRVTYAVIAEEDEERVAELEHFLSLDARADQHGWWLTVYGKVFRPANLVSVKSILHTDADDLPGWCPRRETEWGEIRVPPPQASEIG